MQHRPSADSDRNCVIEVSLDAKRHIRPNDAVEIVRRSWSCVDPILLPAASPFPAYATAALLIVNGLGMMNAALRLRRDVARTTLS